MRQRKQLPVWSRVRPTEERKESTYDRYVSIHKRLGTDWAAIKRGWAELSRASEMAAQTRTIIKPLNF